MEGLSETSRVILKSFRLGNCDPTVSSRYLHTYKEEDNQFFVVTKRSYDCYSAANSPTNSDQSEEQERDGEFKPLRTFIFNSAR